MGTGTQPSSWPRPGCQRRRRIWLTQRLPLRTRRRSSAARASPTSWRWTATATCSPRPPSPSATSTMRAATSRSPARRSWPGPRPLLRRSRPWSTQSRRWRRPRRTWRRRRIPGRGPDARRHRQPQAVGAGGHGQPRRGGRGGVQRRTKGHQRQDPVVAGLPAVQRCRGGPGDGLATAVRRRRVPHRRTAEAGRGGSSRLHHGTADVVARRRLLQRRGRRGLRPCDRRRGRGPPGGTRPAQHRHGRQGDRRRPPGRPGGQGRRDRAAGGGHHRRRTADPQARRVLGWSGRRASGRLR